MDKERIMGIDYGDHVLLAYNKWNGKLYGAKEIERLIGKCADMGATAIYWRTANTGAVMVRSQVRTRMDELVQPGRVPINLLMASLCTRRPTWKKKNW